MNRLHGDSDFLTSGHSKHFTILPNIHPFTHRQRSQPRSETASSTGAVRLRCLAQGHLDTLGGAGDRTSNLPVTSQPAPPPEPHGDTHSCFLIREETSWADFLLEVRGVGIAGTMGEFSFSSALWMNVTTGSRVSEARNGRSSTQTSLTMIRVKIQG